MQLGFYRAVARLNHYLCLMATTLSILMPVRDAGAFLEACLKSIRGQSFKDWELIAVDDGSKDDSMRILHEFSEEDERIRVYRQAALGIIPALRLAFKQSRGSLLTRMDADDLMHPEKLKALVAAAKQYGPGHIITGHVQYFHAKELGDGYRRYANWLNGLKDGRWPEVYRECVIPSPCWLMHRDDLIRAGAFDSDEYPEDYDLCFRCMASGLKVRYAPQAIHLWRDHPERSSRNDPNYADNRFLHLKLHYFLQLSNDKNRELILWGAGKKGKWIARNLKQKNVSFSWISNNPEKVGKEIYDRRILPEPSIWDNFKSKQLIIAIASPDDQKVIINKLTKANLSSGEDYFFFA